MSARSARPRCARLGVSLLSLALAGALGTPAALAQSNPAPDPVAAEAEALTNQYDSLSAALVSYYAQTSGKSLSAYLESNADALALGAVDGAGAPQSGALAADLGKLNPKSTEELNRELSEKGFGLGEASFANLDEAGERLASRSGSPDARVVAAGAAYAKKLGQVRMPALTTPKAGNVDAAAYQTSKAELAYGLVLNKSITNMVNDHPALFAQVQRSGLTSPEARKAWDASLLKANAEMNKPASRSLPAPCEAAMMSVIGQKDPKAAEKILGKNLPGCNGCVAAGLYLSHSFDQVFNPKANAILTTPEIKPAAGTTPHIPLVHLLNGGLEVDRDASVAAMPNLVDSLNASFTPSREVTSCTTASAGASSTVKTVMPSIFASLESNWTGQK